MKLWIVTDGFSEWAVLAEGAAEAIRLVVESRGEYARAEDAYTASEVELSARGIVLYAPECV